MLCAVTVALGSGDTVGVADAVGSAEGEKNGVTDGVILGIKFPPGIVSAALTVAVLVGVVESRRGQTIKISPSISTTPLPPSVFDLLKELFF